MLNGLGTYYTNIIPEITPWFEDSGYNVITGTGTIEELKAVSGDGVFYFQSHGGLMATKEGEDIYGFWTATEVNRFNEVLYGNDIDVGRIAYAAAPHNINPFYDVGAPDDDELRKNPFTYAVNYGITADFVDKYMSFSNDSVAFLNICKSENEGMKSMFIKKGVSLYAGWNGNTNEGIALPAARFFFDRLLGTNEEPPKEEPKQRPFDYPSIVEDMGNNNLLTASGNGATLIFTKGKNEFIALMPSIAYMEVYEDSDELWIYGLFGSKQGDVSVGGSSAPVNRWDQDIVVVEIKDQQVGDVLVKVDEHESNVVPLTEWDGDITYTFSMDPLSPNLKSKADIKAHFRGDVHAYREVAGGDPVKREVKIQFTGDSTAELTSEGSANIDGATFSVTGQGIPPVGNQPPNHDVTGHFEMIGVLNPQGTDPCSPPLFTDVNFHIHFGDDQSIMTIVIPGFPTQESGFPLGLTDVLINQTFDLDANFNIIKGSRSGIFSGAVVGGVNAGGNGVLE